MPPLDGLAQVHAIRMTDNNEYAGMFLEVPDEMALIRAWEAAGWRHEVASKSVILWRRGVEQWTLNHLDEDRKLRLLVRVPK